MNNSLDKDGILSAINYLNHFLDEIDNYPDKALFFQDPMIIEGWILLVQTVENIKEDIDSEDNTLWEERAETCVSQMLIQRELWVNYGDFLRAYYGKLKKLLDGYGEWLEGGCISADGIEALSKGQYGNDLKDVDNITKYLTELNDISLEARLKTYKVLSDIHRVFIALMNRCGDIIGELNPSDEDFANAINEDLRGWTRNFGADMFAEMKEDMNRHYKDYRTAPYTPELWGQMLDADEEALKMAKKQQLAECNEKKQEHWGEDMKKQMDENGKLMSLIYSLSRTEELFDFGKIENLEPFIPLLTTNNLSMFYDIIVRRNLIQCEMFPELKIQHKEWLKGNIEQQLVEETSELEHDRRTKLDDIIQILQNGNWKLPATSENIVQVLNTVFGKDQSSYDDSDILLCKKMWALVEGGRGDRKMIVSANLAGFFSEENLLAGTSTEISIDLFGNNNYINNINDGKKKNRSIAFEEVIPFLTKYTNKIIRQA